MRIVAKVQISTSTSQNSPTADILAVLDRWSARKFERDAEGGMRIRHSKTLAEFDQTNDIVDDQRIDKLVVLQPVTGGHLETMVSIVSRPDRTFFHCTLGLSSENSISVPDVEIRSPKFVRDVVALRHEWTLGSGGERVFPHAFAVGEEELDIFESLMRSPLRRLPLIVVSELDGEPLAGNLHEKVSEDLCGLAHVVRIKPDASWKLTERNGKEWSVYNGAVRLFWPFRLNDQNHRAHPLWTWEQLLRGAESEPAARDIFRSKLARRIIEASTFISDDSAVSDFEAAKTRSILQQARAAAATGDVGFRDLADMYARDNDRLGERLADQEKEISTLRQNIEALTIALRTSQDVSEIEEDDPEIKTVSAAVERARSVLKSTLSIAPETASDVADLNQEAGPPAKIYRYLSILSELSSVLATGTNLKKSIPMWLRERGVECSGESESSKNNRESRAFRTRMINGETFECEYHAKPTDGVSPDMCVRIYFTICKLTPCVRIGYIGRHEA